MIPLTLAELATATGASLHGIDEQAAAELVVDGPVVTDSRAAGPGSLYVARIGEHADGHAYAPQAVTAGAVAVLGSRAVDGVPTLVVDDVQTAFGEVARLVLARRREGAPIDVVAVTGSSGKTSTKDLLAHVLATAGETLAPVESLNGEIGVPLTICRLTDSTRYLVLEMGARGIGHIAYLTRMAPPDVSAVLNVGTAHVGEFGSRENIAVAKGELVEALGAGGLAVLNADDELVAAMAPRSPAPVVLVGRDPHAAVRAEDVELGEDGCARFTLVTNQGTAPVQLGLVGEHQVGNALTVAAVALHLELSLEDVAAALCTARPVSRWRMEVTERPDGVTIVNDAYNANPDSMRAGLAALARLGSPSAAHPQGRRTWAVLGSMLELGEGGDAEHEGVGRSAVEAGIRQVLAVGDGAAGIARGAEAAASEVEGEAAQVRLVADADAARRLLDTELSSGDVVLLKSSRDAGLRWLGDDLAAVASESAEAAGSDAADSSGSATTVSTTPISTVSPVSTEDPEDMEPRR